MLTTFLTHFNTIDKQLDVIIGSDKFLPYNEKVNKISHGRYPLTPWIRQHHEQLKYFGEMRNLLIHHQGESHNYVQLTSTAIADIEKIARLVSKPPSVREYMTPGVVICTLDDQLRDVIQRNGNQYDHIPVLSDGEIMGGVSSELFVSWIATQGSVDMQTLHVRDIPLVKPHHYHIISTDVSILDAVHLFADRGDYHALIITDESGIIGIITRHDVPGIVEKIR